MRIRDWSSDVCSSDLDLLAVEAASGAAKTLCAETAKTWVNVTGNLRPLKDGSLLWSSDRDGFMHLYRWADGAMTQLTRGTWTVQKLIGVDQAAHRAFFTANRDEAIEEQDRKSTRLNSSHYCASRIPHSH